MKPAREIIADVMLGERFGWRHLNDEDAARILSALDAAGYAVVPKEPTEEMVDAGSEGIDQYYDNTKDAPFEGSVAACYQAMLAASTRPPHEQKD